MHVCACACVLRVMDVFPIRTVSWVVVCGSRSLLSQGIIKRQEGQLQQLGDHVLWPQMSDSLCKKSGRKAGVKIPCSMHRGSLSCHKAPHRDGFEFEAAPWWNEQSISWETSHREDKCKFNHGSVCSLIGRGCWQCQKLLVHCSPGMLTPAQQEIIKN